MVFTSPYGATSIDPLPSVHARIILLRDKDLSRDLGISRVSPGIPGIRVVNPKIFASLLPAYEFVTKVGARQIRVASPPPRKTCNGGQIMACLEALESEAV
jgi:hypothetical protein